MIDRLLGRLTAIPGFRSMWTRFPIASVETRVTHGIFMRPHYAYGVYAAATLAKSLKLPAISVIEFGVAGGQGLLALEDASRLISQATGVQITVAGFDGGTGMPMPVDYRDLPHVWGQGFYAMDEAALRAKLAPSTQLILGDVKATVPKWLTASRAPIGFVSFDLDYYSSTMAAFSLFDGGPESRIPRVYCYFDDIIWPTRACFNEFTGELAAIRDFNARHEYQKICPVHHLRWTQAYQAAWNEQIYVFHDFRHPLYCTNITPQDFEHTQM